MIMLIISLASPGGTMTRNTAARPILCSTSDRVSILISLYDLAMSSQAAGEPAGAAGFLQRLHGSAVPQNVPSLVSPGPGPGVTLHERGRNSGTEENRCGP